MNTTTSKYYFFAAIATFCMVFMAVLQPVEALAEDSPPFVQTLNRNHHCVLFEGTYRLATLKLNKRQLRNARRSNGSSINPSRLRVVSEKKLTKISRQIPRLRRRIKKAPDIATRDLLRARLQTLRRTDRLASRCGALVPPAPAIDCLPPSGSQLSVVRSATRSVSTSACPPGTTVKLVSNDSAKGEVTFDGSNIFYRSFSQQDGEVDAVRLKVCEESTSKGLLQKCFNDHLLVFTSCGISLAHNTGSAYAGSANDITPLSNNSCGSNTRYSVTLQPQVGAASTPQNKLILDLPYESPASVRLGLRPCDANGAGCEANSEEFFVAISEALEFSGNPDSLREYRQAITQSERLHLLRRLGYGHVKYLEGNGKTLNLNAFLEQRLLNVMWHASDVQSMLESLREAGASFSAPSNNDLFIHITEPDAEPGQLIPLFVPQDDFSNPLQQRAAVDRLLAVSGRAYHPTLHRYFWGTEWSAGNLLVQSRYLSASEVLMSHLWYGHFGVSGMNLSGPQEHLVAFHAQLVQREALGNFRNMMTGSSASGCRGEGEEEGFICNGLANHFLDNHLNRKGALNENFSREFMELFTLGTSDLITGLPNYSDLNDVNAAASFLSGYKMENQHLVYDAARHDDTPRNAFQGLSSYYPGLAITNQSMTARQFVNHLLDHHPSASRFIARRLFSMLVYPDPPDHIIEELADLFRASDYDIHAVITAIGRSEAMFSEKARYRQCVMDPFRRMAETTNMLQLPLMASNGPYGNVGGSALFLRLYNHKRRLASALKGAGERVMSYPDIFSHNYCGRNPGVDGAEEWLPGARILGRIRGTIDMLRESRSQLGDEFNLTLIRNMIMNNPFNGTKIGSAGAITENHMIDFFSLIYNVSLSNEEKAVIATYLSTNHAGSPVAWNAANDTLFVHKTAGLIAIFSSLAQANIH